MLSTSYNTCKNGHNFEAGLTECPFCPKPEATMSGAKTLVEGSRFDSDKTVVDIDAPRLVQPEGKTTVPDHGKTVIYSPSQAHAPGIRKLIGWLVTFDISPAGIDYKLYVGKQSIGRGSNNEIMIQQPGISDTHATLLYRDDKLMIRDEFSTNGTFVNDESVGDRRVLENDDVIKIGSVSLKLKLI